MFSIRLSFIYADDHADLSLQTGLRGILQDYNRKIQLKSSSTLPVSLTGMKSNMLIVKRPFSTSHSSVDSKEMKKFQLLAHKWWDEEGEYAALHSMNDIRVPFIRDTLLSMSSNYHPGNPLSGIKILDVGCGGGLLSEPLGRLGASVTGIDPVEDNISTADRHKSFDPVLAKRIQYKSSSLEEIVEESMETFDVIVASEVVEHVADLEMFIKCCSQVLKPEGSLFITTINKTQLSYVLGIVVAEKIMGIVPEGTHEWEKFVSPEELERLLESSCSCISPTVEVWWAKLAFYTFAFWFYTFACCICMLPSDPSFMMDLMMPRRIQLIYNGNNSNS
ncbi:ubiquinone biosynthesis O-methyltransferase, mitochondrial isoform X3 [Corvus kubaryi]|uniref:ubiquinone biosynthesis O-methyltransferase, mitochondrial isoform X3 n=1 Tax=Corvus kubaryi TaxID=68294 RepID=UPI001C04927B|nr:ubiquinone biosynthesis O-methyltransferase, mitochondrial isoform X3 [Corvus kubaryi]